MKTFCVPAAISSLIVALCLGAPAAAAEDELFSAARDLYASAAYEQALSTLGRLPESTGDPAVREQIDQYRAFCLFALGRTADAEAIAESLTRQNPMMQLLTEDASPRLLAMFTDVRKRLLPDLIREHYRAARNAMDVQDLSAAKQRLEQLRQMLEQAEQMGAIDGALADMPLLVEGFLRLVQSPVPSRVNAPVTASQPARGAVAPPGAAATPGDAEVARIVTIPPVAIRQDVPQVPPSLVARLPTGITRGTLELMIDERGDVEQSAMRESIHPVYDDTVVRASRRWKYQPAMSGNLPVKYLKTIEIVYQK
jgi:hypothetical protein